MTVVLDVLDCSGVGPGSVSCLIVLADSVRRVCSYDWLWWCCCCCCLVRSSYVYGAGLDGVKRVVDEGCCCCLVRSSYVYGAGLDGVKRVVDEGVVVV